MPHTKIGVSTHSRRLFKAMSKLMQPAALAGGLILAGATLSADTIAYYRFESGVAGNTITTAVDETGNNPMTGTLVGTSPSYYNSDLLGATIPQNGNTNLMASDYTAGNGYLAASTTGVLASEPFQNITIEAYVKMNNLSGYQTIVGRDDSGAPGQATDNSALLYLSKSGANNGFRIELKTKGTSATGADCRVDSNFVPTIGTWYHVAAVGDSTAGTLTLYVDGVSVGQSTGFNGLFVPTAGSNTPWTIGRGQWAGGSTDYLNGYVDEVRISNTALKPYQFLNYVPGTYKSPTIEKGIGGGKVVEGKNVTLSVGATSQNSTETGTTELTYQWYKNDTILTGQTAATLDLGAVTTA